MSKAPPVPPANRSDKGPGATSAGEKAGDLAPPQHHPEKRNLAEQGRQGNIRQNTHHQGYQQDR